MNDYYPPGTPYDFLEEDEPIMKKDFPGDNEFDIREPHWITDWGLIRKSRIGDFVRYLMHEEDDIVHELVSDMLNEEWAKGGDW